MQRPYFNVVKLLMHVPHISVWTLPHQWLARNNHSFFKIKHSTTLSSWLKTSHLWKGHKMTDFWWVFKCSIKIYLSPPYLAYCKNLILIAVKLFYACPTYLCEKLKITTFYQNCSCFRKFNDLPITTTLSSRLKTPPLFLHD